MVKQAARTLASVCFLMSVLAASAWAADVVELDNGSKIRGRITAQTDTSVSVRTRGGMEMTFPLKRVHAITTSAGRKVYSASTKKPPGGRPSN